jgi:hypothetical protein
MDSRAAAETTAFFYGKPIPAELTQAYDQVVVEPGHNHDVAALSKSHAVLVAYLSMGEVAKHKLDQTDKTWRLSQNDAWASTVMDLTHPGYRKYLLDQYEALWSKGYHRFFLDTLDSYQLGTKDAKQRELQRKALCELISGMVSRHAEVRILLNRCPRSGSWCTAWWRSRCSIAGMRARAATCACRRTTTNGWSRACVKPRIAITCL